jgi:DNA-binding Xre family transcriptional regulator
MGAIFVLPTRFRLHELLAARGDGMSQAELARRAGLSNTTVNDIALNKSTRISLETITAICEVLGVKPGDLFAYEPERSKPVAGEPRKRRKVA